MLALGEVKAETTKGMERQLRRVWGPQSPVSKTYQEDPVDCV